MFSAYPYQLFLDLQMSWNKILLCIPLSLVRLGLYKVFILLLYCKFTVQYSSNIQQILDLFSLVHFFYSADFTVVLLEFFQGLLTRSNTKTKRLVLGDS